MKPNRPLLSGRSSPKAPIPLAGHEQPPAAASAPANRKLELNAARQRRSRKREKTGEVCLPGKTVQDWKAIRLLHALGMKTLSEDADRSEIIAAWNRYLEIQFGPE